MEETKNGRWNNAVLPLFALFPSVQARICQKRFEVSCRSGENVLRPGIQNEPTLDTLDERRFERLAV